ncbi:MAG: peptide chain release factor N(5)-glutamine methyltransferase [Deltaproteobacteria bacterium]|nr:peptide chain release factor N(5)-glutamine methyltransferase [Deltaproteobacteria bacterium]MBW2068958.1 peptide chain release factor N(5)-glutamine methyltransferase [Deltaproteobacteria bacterium]
MSEKKWTILEVLKWTSRYFQGKGISNPRTDAEVLLAHALGVERIDLYLRYDQPLTADERAVYREFVRRRASGEPVQYITGHREFWSLDFEVTPDVLIPRPETEVLVEIAIKYLKERRFRRVVDIGTGAGVIAVALAHEIDGISVLATDISSSAINVARRNAVKHGVADRIRFIVMNLFESLLPDVKFDVIVSNPPYVSSEEYRKLDREIKNFEPSIALLGGADGLDVVRRLIVQGMSHLTTGGFLFIEIGYGQAEAVRDFVSGLGQEVSINIFDDYAHIPRVVCIEKIR